MKRFVKRFVKQSGYALLLSLFVVLGLSGVWLAGTMLNYSPHTAALTLELSLARSALISYAVNYIDHYGAQGAGIGHLPCPDTDNPVATGSDPWHRDGPNPPCAKQAIEFGWLPRHVNVRDGRYHFHARTNQRLLYAVSGKYVNNPLGRIVNPATEGDMVVGNFTDVVAILIVPSLESTFSLSDRWEGIERMQRDGASFAVIRSADIRTQALQRVGGWLVEKLNMAASMRCQSSKAVEPCSSLQRARPLCDLSAKYVLFHWLSVDDAVSGTDCDIYQQSLGSSFAIFDNVPINRHWFIRNEWFRFVEITVGEDCHQSTELPCQFTLMPRSDKEPLLQIQLQPLSRLTDR